MKLIRIVVSDLHLGTGARRGSLNPMEDFYQDERFAELLQHYVGQAGPHGGVELILNGDIFDLLKVKIGGRWPTEITDEVATEKLRLCLEGHPTFVHALKTFIARPENRMTFLPGNHDLDMWFPGPQELFRRYVAPGDASERVQFITDSDTYYLPEGIQVRHGHQFEHIHRVDYRKMTVEKRGQTQLWLPWGSLWILEVLNPLKEVRTHIDRVQPQRLFLWISAIFDFRFLLRFFWHSGIYFVRYRVLTIRAWRERITALPRMIRDELLSLTHGYDEYALQALRKTRGVHTLIVGHSHGPRYIQLPSGKILVNTGTWVRMINLDLQYLGQDSGLTYAVIEYDDEGAPSTGLFRWRGSHTPCEAIPYAD